MRRCILRKGDKSVNGGIVTQGMENCTDHGVPITYIGAEVWCNGCKTVGHIGSKGPHRPAFMHGKQEALDGDICLCKCTPPPVIRASQDHSYHSFEVHELVAMGYDERGQSLPVDPVGDYDERVCIVDSSGRPIASAPYHIRAANGAVYKGLTDSKGYCPRIYTEDASRLDIAVGLQALERWEQ